MPCWWGSNYNYLPIYLRRGHMRWHRCHRTEGFCISRQQSHQCQCLVSQLFDEMTWSKCLWTLSASSGSQIDYFFQACQIGIPLEKSGASGIHHWKRNSWSIWVRFFSTLFKIHQISDDVILGSYQIFMLRKLWLSTFFSLILPTFNHFSSKMK